MEVTLKLKDWINECQPLMKTNKWVITNLEWQPSGTIITLRAEEPEFKKMVEELKKSESEAIDRVIKAMEGK